MKCLICEVGTLAVFKRAETMRYKNRDLRIVDLCFSVCSECQAELVMPAQVKSNQVRIADAQRTVDGLLSTPEIVQIRQTMRLNRSQASKVFGGGPNAFSKYERGEIHPSLAVNKLMQLARNVPEARQNLLENAGLVSVKPQRFEKPRISVQPAWSVDCPAFEFRFCPDDLYRPLLLAAEAKPSCYEIH